ncbi:acyltransferase [uncultured Cellulomonas sp.]|uniref:acyltransferase family protein n=1 Tax=uncultured Cellulomonas sp. TaxID=189682 RepID=UPI0028E1EEBA|nr:acyltransferase [uncultured Cellulomonas sp.]
MSAASALEDPQSQPQPPRRALRRALTGRELDPRNNSLNLIRLVLAATVLFAHTYYIAGRGVGPHIDGENLGGWAVFGFFTISGYLITASRLGNGLGTYLVHRIARIMPAFWVCLVVTAGVLAPIGYWAVHRTLDGFLTTPTAPASYVFANFFLKIGAYDVAGTPGNVPYPGAWDGSLWSLYYEFLCYLVIAGLLSIAWFRRSPWPLAVAFGVSVAVWAKIEVVMPYLGGNPDVSLLAKLLPLFLGGALVQVLRSRLPLHWVGALGALVVSGVAIAVLDGWGAQLTAPLITYLLLWVASVVPAPRLIQKHDISYGVYIYAFPVQQLLAIAAFQVHGLLLFNLVALAGTVPLAIASWLLVERPIMRRARRTTRPTPAPSATQPDQPAAQTPVGSPAVRDTAPSPVGA